MVTDFGEPGVVNGHLPELKVGAEDGFLWTLQQVQNFVEDGVAQMGDIVDIITHRLVEDVDFVIPVNGSQLNAATDSQSFPLGLRMGLFS